MLLLLLTLRAMLCGALLCAASTPLLPIGALSPPSKLPSTSSPTDMLVPHCSHPSCRAACGGLKATPWAVRPACRVLWRPEKLMLRLLGLPATS